MNAHILPLRDELSQSYTVSGASHLCVLIDPILKDPLESHPLRDSAVPINIRHPSLSAAQKPYLLPLREVGRDDTIDETLHLCQVEAARHDPESGRGRSICGWIAYDGELKQVANKMLLHSRGSAAGRGRMIRVWDPRVLDLLIACVTPSRLQHLGNGVAGWWWLSRHGNWRSLPPSLKLTASDSTMSTELTSDEVRLLELGESINRGLDALQDASFDMAMPDICLRVARLVEQGVRRWKLNGLRDQSLYAVYGMLLSPDFDQHEEVQKAMQNACASGVSPMASLEAFDDNYWERQRHD